MHGLELILWVNEVRVGVWYVANSSRRCYLLTSVLITSAYLSGNLDQW